MLFMTAQLHSENVPPVPDQPVRKRVAPANDRVQDPQIAFQMHTRYLGLIGMAWASFLIVSILVAGKLFTFHGFEFSVAILSYPFTYLFSDVFTEVYGYRHTRRIVWTGLAIMMAVSVLIYAMVRIPPSPSYPDQDAFAKIFGAAPFMSISCIIAFFCGEMTNSFVLAKMKIVTKGKHLWARTTSSTAAGQLVDNTTFFTLAYFTTHVYDGVPFWNVALTAAASCALYEFMMTPLTYKIVNFLKRAESMDVYDRGTNFNPFKINS